MKNSYNILTIGDIHGLSKWKEIIFGGETEFFYWKLALIDGYLELDDQYRFQKDWDRIIFLGDYVDSFTISNQEILENLEDIILFANTYSDLVVLLLGNHDVQYIVDDEICSGYRPEMRFDLNKLFVENSNLFKISYLDEYYTQVHKRETVTRTLWTHAGVTHGWFSKLKKDVTSEQYRHRIFFENIEEMQIDEILNLSWDLRVDNLFDVDFQSGGTDLWAGPFWVRPDTLNEFCLEDYNQVVGHTPKSKVIVHCPLQGVESNPENLNTIVYADALPKGDFYQIKRRPFSL